MNKKAVQFSVRRLFRERRDGAYGGHFPKTFCRLVLVFGLLLVTVLANAARTGFTHLDQPWQAPEFRLEDLQGQMHSLAEHRGKVLIINFWATYCKPCLKEMPSLQRVWEQLRDEDIEVLAIDVGEPRDWILEFKGIEAFRFPILLDHERVVTGEFGVRGIPTTFIVDPAGRVVIKAVGEFEWDSPEILEKVRALKQG